MSAPMETPSTTCAVCGGRGWNLFILQGTSFQETCPACLGTGKRKGTAAIKWDAVMLVVAVLILFALVALGGHR